MQLEPTIIVLYVDDMTKSLHFYQQLLNIEPKESSPTFSLFQLSNGMGLGIKARHTMQPLSTHKSWSEFAFMVDRPETVDEMFLAWQQKNISFLQTPTQVPFGYCFIAQDPDDNRLRVLALHQA
jgi:predicted enzyme related to lactoylglutathione lyase